MVRIRARIALALMRLVGWKKVGSVPGSGIFVGAPHTSNWDFVAAVLVVWADGLSPKVLVKKEFFHGPLAWLLNATGGIPVDRENARGVVDRLAAEAARGKSFVLVLAAEGTREKVEFWKSGFYRLGQQTGLPIYLGFIDGPTKSAGVGPVLTPSGDVHADMELVRAFYADKLGINPEKRTEPRLREEAA